MNDPCAFTGHRPQRFPWRYNEKDPRCEALKAVLAEQIGILIRAGTLDFFSGMALGVDTWSASAVITLREKNPAIKLHCVLPCEKQEIKWSFAARETYYRILKQADSIQYVSRYYHNGCMMERNRQLVDLSSVLLAVYNGQPSGGTAATIRYAREQKKRILCIDPISLAVTEE